MNIIETIKNNDLLKVFLIIVAVYFFMKYYNREGLENVVATPPASQPQPKVVQPQVQSPPGKPILQPQEQQRQIEAVVAGQTQLTTNDLLPKYDDANDFAKQNPVSKLLQEQNFLQSGYHMGINTVVQSNKIPYLDLRSCPPIPKQDIGPFNNSSYEEPAGSGRRALEIGV
jgi:hypothetical protein